MEGAPAMGMDTMMWGDSTMGIDTVTLRTPARGRGLPRSRLELGHWEKGYLSVVESGDRRVRIKAGGIPNLRHWEILERYFCIWICQNKVQRPRHWGNIVEVFLDRLYTLGMARFYPYVVLQDGVLSCPASPDSEQLGVPTVPGRSGWIGLRLGYILEHIKRCSTLSL